MPKAGACACAAAVSEQELMARYGAVIDEYKSKPGALIPMLQTAQTMFGYLPDAVLRNIARTLDKSYTEVAGVAGFYSFFSTVPRGKFLVRVCLGTACYVRGGNDVLAAMKKALGIDVGQTTEDRLFSLEIGRCFGACGLAPVIMVNDDVHQRVRPSKVGEILDKYRAQTRKEKRK
jgi:NADH:ubiquinone oxidoreductase subunit E